MLNIHLFFGLLKNQCIASSSSNFIFNSNSLIPFLKCRSAILHFGSVKFHVSSNTADYLVDPIFCDSNFYWYMSVMYIMSSICAHC